MFHKLFRTKTPLGVRLTRGQATAAQQDTQISRDSDFSIVENNIAAENVLTFAEGNLPGG